MLCPVLVGRDEPLAALRDRWAEAVAGRGGWVNVVGEAGVGKSRLIAQLAATVGVAPVRGSTSLVDRVTPFRPLVQVLLDVSDGSGRPSSGAVAPYVAAVSAFVPGWGGDGNDVLVSPAVMAESVARLVVGLRAPDPVLVVLEDLHWADPETAAACAHLAGRAGGRILFVATFRPEEIDPKLAAELRRRPTVVLAPLTTGEVEIMARHCLGAEPSSEQRQRLSAGSAGLPLLVEELLDERAAGPRYADVVRARVDALDERSRAVIAAGALVGEVFSRPVVRAAVPGADSGLGEALRVGLLVEDDEDRVRFRHAVTHQLVSQLTVAEQAEVAAAVAAALAASDEPMSGIRAGELWAHAGEPSRALETLERVAAQALASGAIDVALVALEHATRVQADDARRRDLELHRLDLLVQAGRMDQAAALADSLADRGGFDREQASRLHLRRARLALASGATADAERWLGQVDRGLHHAERLILEADLLLRGGGGEHRAEAEHLARHAVAAAIDARQVSAAVAALELTARCARSRSLAEAAGHLDRALALADEHSLAAERIRLLNELGTIDMLAHAAGDRLARAREAALAAGVLEVAVSVDVNLASLDLMRNALDRARRRAAEAREAALRIGALPLAAVATVTEALADGLVGNREGMERKLRKVRDLGVTDPDLDAFAWGVGRGLCALVREDRTAARDAFSRAWRADAPIGVLDTARAPLLLVSAVDRTATPEQRADAHAVATPGAAWSDLWLGYADAVLQGPADPAAALDAFAAADARARHYPLFRAIALRLVAEAALRDGWGDPVDWLRDAEATYVAGGQTRAATACRTLLERAGAGSTRRRGADRALPARLLQAGVTAREADVLDLLAERLGNKEIAARLYLSPRTVEKHVASLRAKLGAADRAALAALADELR